MAVGHAETDLGAPGQVASREQVNPVPEETALRLLCLGDPEDAWTVLLERVMEDPAWILFPGRARRLEMLFASNGRASVREELGRMVMAVLPPGNAAENLRRMAVTMRPTRKEIRAWSDTHWLSLWLVTFTPAWIGLGVAVLANLLLPGGTGALLGVLGALLLLAVPLAIGTRPLLASVWEKAKTSGGRLGLVLGVKDGKRSLRLTLRIMRKEMVMLHHSPQGV